MLKVDLHIHTIFCGHAYGTLYDIIGEAKRKGMKIIGINEHGPKVSGDNIIHHLKIGRRKPEFEDLTVLWGCEVNLIGEDGTIDIQPDIIERLDYFSISYHDHIFTCQDVAEAMIKSMKKYKPLFICHPYVWVDEKHHNKLFQAACDLDVLLELNLSTLGHPNCDLSLIKNMIDIVRKNNKKLIVNSDAHFIHELGNDELLKKHWDELGLTDDLIINNYPEELLERLK